MFSTFGLKNKSCPPKYLIKSNDVLKKIMSLKP